MPSPSYQNNKKHIYNWVANNREKHNINPRNKQWLGGWYTLDFLNTRLHRYKRLKFLIKVKLYN